MKPNECNYQFNIKDINSKINNLANRENIRKWDLGAISSKDLSVQVDKGESKQLKGSQRKSLTIRVWNKNNQLGITSTSDLTNLGLEKAFIGASDASNYGNINQTPEFSVLSNSKLPKVNHPSNHSAGIHKLLETLKQAESQLIQSHNYINSVPYNGLSEARIERIYTNSIGASRQMEVTQASIYLFAKGQDKGKKPRSAGSVKVAYGLEDLDIQSCIQEALSKITQHIDYKPIETNKYLVCFSPEAFLDLIGSFSNMFNARSILDGVSLSNKSSLGTDISVPFLTLSDEALHKKNIASFTFDGEGTPKKDLKLIDNGKLINLLHSEATAREFNVAPTGHGSLGSKATVSPDWFVVNKSNNTACKYNTLSHESTNEKYVLIDNLNALHAGIKASQGSFSLPFDGWLVDRGQRVSIDAATVAGDIRYLLNNIIQIENNQVITSQGISPYIWVNNLSITGEA
tara:strand:- start:1057 stop:2436 length:1380 start_codon:yes stop_codon:yes gene_type:complete